MRLTAVSHNGTRTGAPLVLLEFLRWARAEAGVDVSVLLLHDGPLRHAFAELGPVVVRPAGPRGALDVLADGLLELGQASGERILDRWRVRRALSRLDPPDVMLLNGMTSGTALRAEVRSPVLCWVHELPHAFERSLPAEDLGRVVRRVDHWAAVTPAVAEHVAGAAGIPTDEVSVIPGFVDLERGHDSGAGAARGRLGLRPDDLLAGAMGQGTWRKGVDLFVQLAGAVRRTAPELAAHFVWVGDVPDRDRLLHDAFRLGVADRLHLVGEVGEAAAWHEAFDVHVLTSREDPFPLVALEAGRASTPLVTFDAGGAADLVRSSGGGIVVEYLDLSAMAAATVELLTDAGRRTHLGRGLRQWVEHHHGTQQVAPRLLDELEHIASPG